MSAASIEIIFENETAIFREGSQVTGLVVIENSEDIKYNNIRLELRGVAAVFWNSHDDNDRPKLIDEIVDFKGDCNKEQYFQKVVLHERESSSADAEYPVLQPGEHSFPFACRMLPDLPPSFEGRYGCVRYEARAVVDRKTTTTTTTGKATSEGATSGGSSKTADIFVRRPITVTSGLDLSFVNEASTKIEICKYRELGLCCTEGSVTFDWVVDRSGFISGDQILIQGSVQNDSKHTVSHSSVTLYTVIEYRANKKRRVERNSLATVEKGCTRTDDVTVWNEPIHIPDSVPSSGINRCRLIDIRYELEFRASIDGGYPPVVVVKEIYIGTVPLMRNLRSSASNGSDRVALGGMGTAGVLMEPWDDCGGSSSLLRRTSTGSPYHSPVEVLRHCPIHPLYYYNSSCSPAACPACCADQPPGSAYADPSAPLLPPPTESQRPPPFAPGHEDDVTRLLMLSTASTSQSAKSDQQIEKQPAELQAPPYNPAFVPVVKDQKVLTAANNGDDDPVPSAAESGSENNNTDGQAAQAASTDEQD